MLYFFRKHIIGGYRCSSSMPPPSWILLLLPFHYYYYVLLFRSLLCNEARRLLDYLPGSYYHRPVVIWQELEAQSPSSCLDMNNSDFTPRVVITAMGPAVLATSIQAGRHRFMILRSLVFQGSFDIPFFFFQAQTRKTGENWTPDQGLTTDW